MKFVEVLVPAKMESLMDGIPQGKSGLQLFPSDPLIAVDKDKPDTWPKWNSFAVLYTRESD